ncbi:MAG TPA: C39 family peptidase [Chthoniobacteraceae bacterium]|nr:C39 family peptidase [Chthoniobacteraceae bacterium]
MQAFRIILAAACLSVTSYAQTAFDTVFAHPQLWSLDQDGFEKATPGLRFEWTSSARDSARAASRSGMTLFGRPVYEVVARFDGGDKLSMISVNFYARGDAGEITEPAFEALRTGTIETLTKATAQKPVVRGRDPTSAVKAEGMTWTTAKSQYLLESSYTREIKTRNIPFRAEFVRLEVRPAAQKQGLIAASLSSTKKEKFSGPTHVKKDAATGDVWVEGVPMVDQGQKGYCVVASTERVMRYYGNDVDANELAQVANSDAAGGTNSLAMRAALKKLAARLKVRVREHESIEVKQVLAMIRDYNRNAKRSGQAEIPDPGYMIDIGMIYRSMDGAVLKEARTKNKSDMSRFQRDVQSYIDIGIPLLWSVQLGLVPEPGLPQGGGGHMRLIIGYNPKTQEILYSDSWGAGHEQKRMKADDAWTITTQLVTIEPL